MGSGQTGVPSFHPHPKLEASCSPGLLRPAQLRAEVPEVSGTLLHAFSRHCGASTLFQVLFQAQGTVVAWAPRTVPPGPGSRKQRTQSGAY